MYYIKENDIHLNNYSDKKYIWKPCGTKVGKYEPLERLIWVNYKDLGIDSNGEIVNVILTMTYGRSVDNITTLTEYGNAIHEDYIITSVICHCLYNHLLPIACMYIS